MQPKSLITALAMFVQVSQSIPHYEITFNPQAPSPTSTTQPPSNNSASPSAGNAPSMPDFSPGSPEYIQAQNLYSQINQYISQYESGSLPSSTTSSPSSYDIMNRMGNFVNQLLNSSTNNGATAYTQATQPASAVPQSLQTTLPAPQPTYAASSPSPSGSDDSSDAIGSATNFSPSDFLVLINQYRAENNAPPLAIVKALAEDAVQHASYMLSINDLTHDRPQGDDMATSFKQKGYNSGGSIGECIAEGALTTNDVFNAWKTSPDHAAIMRNADYKSLGVALVQNMASAEFSN
ncbi:hypothetical protein CONCODRAFT_8597 [Conidiobolus coronatus NRRL 28638]|uniref:SCP domain-containing protein n=1 Tax=Conidiobolus coronatus (strain ATCC 28846 / CBS 209.66 / NRRL 28638) TaxID=796925 RepID=A0A137P1S6_CONC2|nr:hypothetical protein CONCODRAFT_8597 [Conidiobolus coronatus NRRL 28638]|eukprot:KXN69015.1 hypothetical protein CONCODRAFT_8597 [Conidiobolus coronatus NRRL 28638]